MNTARINLHDLEDVRSPSAMYSLFVCSGVRMLPFKSMGLSQPLHDYVAHDLRSQIAQPFTLSHNASQNELVIEQPETENPAI